MSDRRTYARATAAGYDSDFERALVSAITEAIGRASMAADAPALVIRTGETLSALMTVMAGTLVMSPSVRRSPAAIRKMTDELRRRLHRRIADAERDADVQNFIKRCFRGDVEGNA